MLLIYYPKSSIQSLGSFFNLCLFKLFKFKPEKIDFEDILLENNQDNIMDKFSGTLQKYGLFTFHKRLLDRLLIFAHSILNYENSPPKLKEIIKLPDNSTYYTEIDKYKFGQGA